MTTPADTPDSTDQAPSVGIVCDALVSPLLMALTIELNDRFTVRHVARDSERYNVIKLRCPACGTFADIDDDQYRGRVSVECATPGCTFHETHNFAQLEADALK